VVKENGRRQKGGGRRGTRRVGRWREAGGTLLHYDNRIDFFFSREEIILGQTRDLKFSF
jgi:hypothetical protein